MGGAWIRHSEPFLQLLGCEWSQFTPRIERQLRRHGWEWSDFGKLFEIDHTLPFNAFRLERYEDRLMVNHFSNLKAMDPHLNRIKNGQFSKAELECYKSLWRANYKPRHRQLRLFKEHAVRAPMRDRV